MVVAPVPAQIANLRPRPPAPTAPPLPPSTLHSLFVSPLSSYSYELLFPQPLYFDNDPHCPPGVGVQASQSPSELCASAQLPAPASNPLFSGVCCLFPVSLRSFLRSFPLFSIACSLFSQNTGGGVSRMQLRDTRVGGSMTRYRLSTVDRELRSASAFAAVVGGGGDSHAAEFVSVILAIEDAPLFAVLEDLFF